MAYKLKYILEKVNGEYRTEPILQHSQWVNLLENIGMTKYVRQLDVLLMFYRKMEHKSTCKNVGAEYSLKPNSVNALITNFCRFAKKHSGIDFVIEQDGSNDGKHSVKHV